MNGRVSSIGCWVLGVGCWMFIRIWNFAFRTRLIPRNGRAWISLPSGSEKPLDESRLLRGLRLRRGLRGAFADDRGGR